MVAAVQGKLYPACGPATPTMTMEPGRSQLGRGLRPAAEPQGARGAHDCVRFKVFQTPAKAYAHRKNPDIVEVWERIFPPPTALP